MEPAELFETHGEARIRLDMRNGKWTLVSVNDIFRALKTRIKTEAQEDAISAGLLKSVTESWESVVFELRSSLAEARDEIARLEAQKAPADPPPPATPKADGPLSDQQLVAEYGSGFGYHDSSSHTRGLSDVQRAVVAALAHAGERSVADDPPPSNIVIALWGPSLSYWIPGYRTRTSSAYYRATGEPIDARPTHWRELPPVPAIKAGPG